MSIVTALPVGHCYKPRMMIHSIAPSPFMKLNAFLVGAAGFAAGGLLAALMLLA